MPTRSTVAASGLLVLVGAALLLAGPRPAGMLVAARDPAAWARRVGPDLAALTVAGALCWLVLLWLAVGVLLTAAAAAPGGAGRVAEVVVVRVLPGSVRRLAAGLLGLSLTAAAAGCHRPNQELPAAGAGPAMARHGPARPADAGRADTVDWPLAGPPAALPSSPAGAPGTPWPSPPPGDLSPAGGPLGPAGGGGRVAGRSAPPGPTAAGQPARTSAGRSDHLVVQPGDCLWRIAARHLGGRADAAEVATETRRWYGTNRTIIGADPNLLRPGEVLRSPPEAAP
jgi:hypothetical protein